jgi:hypothetical protein
MTKRTKKMNSQTTSQFNNLRPDLAEIREVHGFERVSLKVQNIENDLVITQGQHEALLIAGDPDLLSRVNTHVSDGELMISITGSWSDFIKEALTTSLTRRRIKFILTVKQLTALDIDGITRLEAAALETDCLRLCFRGPGQANFASLQARALEVDLSGPCKIEVTGKVVEQKVAISAFGYYYAPKLESKKAVARLNGPGQATLWVSDNLDASISGPGRIEYYGAPRVRRSGFPFGGPVSLGNPKEESDAQFPACARQGQDFTQRKPTL